MIGKVDLGDGHWFRFMGWNPDLSLNPQYAHLAHLIRLHPQVGATVGHTRSDGSECEGSIHFDTELTKASGLWKDVDTWQVERWEPLTISPSLRCHCGDHGHIKNGKWVRAK